MEHRTQAPRDRLRSPRPLPILLLVGILLVVGAFLSSTMGAQAYTAQRSGSAAPMVNGGNIANIAKGQIGGACSKYYGCPDPGEWCADFARWVWSQAGVYTSGLTAAAGSFYTYGLSQGTLSRTPHVGDAVVFDYGVNGYGTADHVAIVVQVNSDGTIVSVGGNERGGSGQVAEDGPYSSSLGYSSYWGMDISGYTTAVNSSSGASGAEEVGVFDGHASSFWIDGKNQSGKQVGYCLANSNPGGETVLSNWWWVGQVRVAYYSDSTCTYPGSYYGQVYINAPQGMSNGHVCTVNYDPSNQKNLITNCA